MALGFTVATLKEILNEFATLSGLKCNLEKSILMLVGGMAQVPNFVQDSGFLIGDSMTILGLKIKNNLEGLEECHIKAIEIPYHGRKKKIYIKE